MRTHYFMLALTCMCCSTLFFGCSSEAPTSAGNSGTELVSGKGPMRIAVADAKITLKRVSYSPYCVTPKYNCFSIITVVSGNSTQVGNLGDAITNNTQSTFFATSSNWNTIWGGIPSAILTDLVNGSTKLEATPNCTSTSKEWDAVDVYGNNVDYSGTP